MSRNKNNMAVSFKSDLDDDQKETVLIINGGGLRIAGVAIGALRVLEKYFKENRIKIDRVVGISGGAVIAALFALGYNASQMAKIILHGWTRDIFKDFNLFPLRGIIKGEKIEAVMRWGFSNKKFSEAKIPLSIIVSKLGFSYAKSIIINDGYIHEAVRASVSIPWLLEPKEIRGRLYYDGGITVSSLYEILPLLKAKEVYFLATEQQKPTVIEQLISFYNYLLKWHFLKSIGRIIESFKDVKVNQIITPISDKIELWGTEHFPFLILEGEKTAASFIKKLNQNL